MSAIELSTLLELLTAAKSLLHRAIQQRC